MHINVIKKLVLELETWKENEDPFGIYLGKFIYLI